MQAPVGRNGAGHRVDGRGLVQGRQITRALGRGPGGEVGGVGQAKLDRYGDAVLAIVMGA